MRFYILLLSFVILIYSCNAARHVLETPYALTSGDEKSLGDNKYEISIEGNYFTSNDKITEFFERKASTICSGRDNFNILKKHIKVLEMNMNTIPETFKLSINGIIECK